MIHSIRLLLLCLLIAPVAPLAAEEPWNQFRGPGGQAKRPEANTPLEWDDTKNILWKTPLPGRGASSPVLWGNQIFLTAYSGYGIDETNPGEKDNLRLHVLCLDRETGKVQWDREAPAGEHAQDFSRRVADHGYATATPVCDESGVYAFFGACGVLAYDPNGAEKWRTSVGEKTAGFGSASSPVLYGDLLIINASIESGAVVALDKKTGKPAWSIPNVNRSWTTPSIVKTPKGEDELVISYKETIIGVDPTTGEQLWHCDGIQDYVVPCAVSNDGVVFCLGGRRNQSIAIRAGGRGDVTESHVLWSETIGANVTSPVYHEGHLYWASDKAIANCLDAKTGEAIYRERLPTRARIYASVVLAGDKLYVTTRDQGVVVLPAKPKYDELARNVFKDDESMLNASPAITGDRLLIRSDRFLYCIGK